MGLAFDMKVIAWSQNLDAETCAKAGVVLVDKEGLFREADVLTVHTVLSERTRGLIGARELSWMKPTAYLVNTSRGPIVDESALVEALERRRIAGAGIDVYVTGTPARETPPSGPGQHPADGAHGLCHEGKFRNSPTPTR